MVKPQIEADEIRLSSIITLRIANLCTTVIYGSASEVPDAVEVTETSKLLSQRTGNTGPKSLSNLHCHF